MKFRHLLAGLLLLFILLLAVDICTGIFYWNRLHLVFDASNFNNIVTPIVSTLALATYAATLFYLISQTKIILSQNLKPFFERELEVLNEAAADIRIKSYEGTVLCEYDINNYIKSISNTLNFLKYNSEFQKDIESYAKGAKFIERDIECKEYFDYLDNLTELVNENNPVILHYRKVLAFMLEVRCSKMIQEDRELLINRAKRTFLEPYLDFINELDTNQKHYNPCIPILYVDVTDYIEFKQINKTVFRDVYDKVKKL